MGKPILCLTENLRKIDPIPKGKHIIQFKLPFYNSNLEKVCVGGMGSEFYFKHSAYFIY